MRLRFNNNKWLTNFLLSVLLLSLSFLTYCSGDNGGDADPVAPRSVVEPSPAKPPPVVGSTGSSSGSIGVYTDNGISYAVSPGGANLVKLITLPNSGNSVADITSLQVRNITTSLKAVDGTSIDPLHDIGIAYEYTNSNISIFQLSTASEITIYDTLTVNTLDYSGAISLKISGAIIDPIRQWIILATADGFELVDYSTPGTPVKLREIPSLHVDTTNGVEIIENFAYDPNLPIKGINTPVIITGGASGKFLTGNIGNNAMELIDASTGIAYKPTATTSGLFVLNSYIDSAAVDTNFHVAVLAEEFSSNTHFVDLNHLTLDSTLKTFSLPNPGHKVVTTDTKMTNLALESNNHILFLGEGYEGTTMIIGKISHPAVNLGFSEIMTTFPMPSDNDDQGNLVNWLGPKDPHGVGAYITGAAHPTTPNTSLALWLNSTGDHMAVIDMDAVLQGTKNDPAYDPTATSPKDIAYFFIP